MKLSDRLSNSRYNRSTRGKDEHKFPREWVYLKKINIYNCSSISKKSNFCTNMLKIGQMDILEKLYKFYKQTSVENPKTFSRGRDCQNPNLSRGPARIPAVRVFQPWYTGHDNSSRG